MRGGGALLGHHEDQHMVAEDLTLRDLFGFFLLFIFFKEVLVLRESKTDLDAAIMRARLTFDHVTVHANRHKHWG